MYLKGGVQLNIELVEISRIYIPSPVRPIIRILTPRAPHLLFNPPILLILNNKLNFLTIRRRLLEQIAKLPKQLRRIVM